MSEISVSWPDTIVILNSLVQGIQQLQTKVSSEDLGDDDLYLIEEQLNDYITTLSRLKVKYLEIPVTERSELPLSLAKELDRLCG